MSPIKAKYQGGFRIRAATSTLDSIEERDGAAVLNAPLGTRYSGRLLFVQDGQETPAVPDGEGGARTATGFKFVASAPWRPRPTCDARTAAGWCPPTAAPRFSHLARAWFSVS
ncbi:hypothetical protein ACIBMX_10240 [Streptomyces phaeochromogenes]|uniref:hypothetical protein n=1 Tax=Streptomyces phaeochromogenes TaxID=1923 RepID=UPI0033F30387